MNDSTPCPYCGGESLPIGHGEFFCLAGNVIWTALPNPTCEGIEAGLDEPD